MSVTHRTIPSPNPTFRSLRVIVGEDSYASNGGIIPPEGTLYKDPAFKGFFGRDYLKEFEDFRYVTQDSGTDGALIFVRSMTQQVRDTAFRSTWSFGDHYWHPVLESLNFFEDFNFPRSTNGGRGGKSAIVTGPTYYVRQVYRPSVNEGSRFFTEEFFSDVPYNIPQYPTPVPTAVSYDLPGVNGSIPECLHPRILVPTTRPASASFVLGNQTSTGGALPGQLFPATNFEDWEPYVVSHKQDFQNGYHAIRITVYPPLGSDDIIR